MNTKAISGEISKWKSQPTMKDCYKKLFKSINKTNNDIYIYQILQKIWTDLSMVLKI